MCQVSCEYLSEENSNHSLTKTTKEFKIESETIDFNSELIRFNNININDGLLYFNLILNGEEYEVKTDKEYNKIVLNKIGIKLRPVEISLLIANDISFNITIRTMNNFQEEFYPQKHYSPRKSTAVPGPISFKDKIKMFSGGSSDTNHFKPLNKTTFKEHKKPLKEKQNIENSNDKNNQNKNNPIPISQNQQNKNIIENNKTSQPTSDKKENKSKDDKNFNEQHPNSTKILTKVQIDSNKKGEEPRKQTISKVSDSPKNMKQEEKPKQNNIKESEQKNPKIEEKKIESEEKELFIDGITYEKYLSKLKSENIKEHESGRESFCEGFFIASFPQKDGKVIENSQSFPAPCGHPECSLLPAMKPEIVARYPLKDTKTLELNNLAATICFPTGIKVCYSEETPSMIKDYVTPITNQKGDRYYMMTYHFYHKFMNDIYSKLYEMHPLKHHLMKFGDSYLNMSEEELNDNIVNQIQESLEKSQEFGFRDYVYVPYCICLISKYRYVTEMKKCLQSIYTMIINHLAENKPDLNNLLMYLIHSIPIPERNTRVKFFVPFCNNGIELICPKVQDISVMNTNISTLLRYFTIDKLVVIFRLILFEKKVLFIDDDYTRLSLVTDSFITLLYPFQWVHTYIPIMSDQMLKYLETFLPFLNGINISLMNLVTQVFINNENEDSEEVFIIYISKDKFRLGSSLTSNTKNKYKYIQDNVPALPASMEKELKYKLKRIKDELDSLLKNQKDKKIDLSDIDFRIRNVFIDMFVQMFHDYYKYMTFLDDDVVFNKKLFMEKITNNNDKNFYSEFMDTQLFQQFTQNIVKDELHYFTSKAMSYEPNKKEPPKKNITNKNIKDKLYIIKPDYLQITGENSESIEKQISTKYKMNQPVDEDGIIVNTYRIVPQIDKIKDENYNNQKCLIYTLPECVIQKNKQNENNNESNEVSTKESIIYKALQSLKLKSTKAFAKKGAGMSLREKENIKEIIKDFTVKIFKSEEIEEDQNLKKELQNALNNPFGREVFVSMLSKNVNNIILLKEKSFNLLGQLIYNSLLYILNVEETNKIIEQMVILTRSTKYFGQEQKKKAIITLWDSYKSRIQGISKINQANFWDKWYELEIKKENEVDESKKQSIILEICDIMIVLELTKSFVKNVTYKLTEKEFGKESEQYKTIVGLITDKIIKARYISKAR